MQGAQHLAEHMQGRDANRGTGERLVSAQHRPMTPWVLPAQQPSLEASSHPRLCCYQRTPWQQRERACRQGQEAHMAPQVRVHRHELVHRLILYHVHPRQDLVVAGYRSCDAVGA